ncbi:MAG TPA: DSD1 family PLP-dependent enzyme [Vicinamibacterales bacterium]|nr:DSD1 family PLP-dependent enzyme [Vicinamibacterales bacterium]
MRSSPEALGSIAGAPRTLADIPTPALLVDVAALDRNIGRMAAFFASGDCRLRPHFKAHKTPEIARRQLAAGSCTGITCATVSEAEVAAAICDDILIANEVVGTRRCGRVAALAREVAMTVAVDSVTGLDQLSVAARAAGVTIGVLVDLNVGQGRCGVTPGDEALALARGVMASAGVTLRGVMGYEGHLQPLRDRGEREARTREALHGLVETAQRMRASGLPCDVVSSGGTGTFDISGRIDGITEIQAGSYALMDTDYASVGVPFEQAFSVLGTIVSRPAPDRCVADCGHKSMTKDHGNPAVKGIDGATVTALNDEHATIAVPPTSTLAVGDLIQLLPSHTDPTVNLHDVFYAVDGDRVVDIWPIAARGYAEHRLNVGRGSV